MDLSTLWNLNLSATTATPLLGLETPAPAAMLTADPPEDLTILRVVGDFNLSLTAGIWALALTVQDQTWTPGATILVDADKRLLWSQTYDVVQMAAVLAGWVAGHWAPPGLLLANATADLLTQAPRESVHVDISPNVKLVAGRALYLVAYELSGAGTCISTSSNMRVLFQRSGRR